MSGVSPLTHPRSRIASPEDRFVLTLWTDDPVLAQEADAAGIDRIGVDLERAGKAERQQGRGTWISPHSDRDLAALAPVLGRADLFARVNPVHPESPRELETVLGAGTKVVMLPMVRDPRDAEAFVRLVDGRARIVLLLEHIDGLRRLDELLDVGGIDEIHVGLNDLALSLQLPNRWLVLADDAVAAAGRQVRAAGLRFGLGGIGRVDDTSLPVPADLVYAQYARTGATAALISRSFLGSGDRRVSLASEVAQARRRLAAWFRRGPDAIEAAHTELRRRALAAGW
jgi:2-keto-3-deoxy-L-rhamnonate aldolase RhmA